MSIQIEHEAGLSEFVCPFAYRLECAGGQEPVGLRSRKATGPDNDGEGGCEEGGYCDNGDVGSGEKLLYLLQKWDVRHKVLVVTRIDRGFLKAELLGIRR